MSDLDHIETGGTPDPLNDNDLGALTAGEVDKQRNRLQAIIDADPRLIHDDKGEVKPPHEWPEREALAVQRWSHNQDTNTWNITFHDKNKAADQLARIDGTYQADHEQQNPLHALLEKVPREKLRAFLTQLQILRDEAR